MQLGRQVSLNVIIALQYVPLWAGRHRRFNQLLKPSLSADAFASLYVYGDRVNFSISQMTAGRKMGWKMREVTLLGDDDQNL